MQYKTNTVNISVFAVSDTPKTTISPEGYMSVGFNFGHKEYRNIKGQDGQYKQADPMWMWARVTSKVSAEGKKSLAERLAESYRKNMRLLISGKLSYYETTENGRLVQKQYIDITMFEELDTPQQQQHTPQQALPAVQYQAPVQTQPLPAPVYAQPPGPEMNF